MRKTRHAAVHGVAIAAMLLGLSADATANREDSAPAIKHGEAFTLGGRRGVLTKLDTLPYVESEYTKRFKFDACDNPKLKQLCGAGQAPGPGAAACARSR